MSLGFYTYDGERISAMTGVKGIVLTEERLRAACRPLQDINTSEASIPHLLKKLQEVFSDTWVDEESRNILFEEYDHFQCLAASKAATVFYIRNILLRQCYTAYNRKQISKLELKTHPIYKEVARYFLDYTLFHSIAYPLLESHVMYILDGNIKNQEQFSPSVLYDRRISDSFKAIRGSFDGLSKTTSRKRIATAIDQAYHTSKRTRTPAIEVHKYILRNLNPLSNREFIFLLLFELIHLTYRPILWSRATRLLWEHASRVYPYLRGRLFPDSITPQRNTGRAPALLTTELEVDPVGFDTGELVLPSPEVNLSPRDKLCSDLLWYVISNMAITYALFKLGVRSEEIVNHYYLLRRFNNEWKPGTDLATISFIIPLYNRIFRGALELSERNDSLFSRSLLSDLTHEAVSLYNRCRLEEKTVIENAEPSLASILNCSYMHF